MFSSLPAFMVNIEFLQLCFLTLPFGLVLAINEYLDRRTDWPREVHRKFGHICVGLIVIVASTQISQHTMILYACILFLGAMGSRIARIGSIYNIDRRSLGTALYPIAVLIMVLLWMPDNTHLLQFGVLILTIPDALSALIGSQWGRQIPRFNKSILGSSIFFICTAAVVLLFTQVWWIVLVIAVVLTVVEFFSQWGIDNLLLPISAGFLLLILV